MNVRRFIPLLLLAALVALTGQTADLAAQMPNPPAGFVALFNGKDLTGWKGLVGNPRTRPTMTPEALAQAQEKADAQMREHWSVQDGVLTYTGKGNNLCTQNPIYFRNIYVRELP